MSFTTAAPALLILENEIHLQNSDLVTKDSDLISLNGLITSSTIHIAQRSAIDLEANVLMAMDRNCRKWCFLLSSNLSLLAGRIINIFSIVAAANADALLDGKPGLLEVHLISTLLNEYSCIEQLEWHPEYQGVWSDSETASSAGSVLSTSSLGYFDAIARRLSTVLGNRVAVHVSHFPLSAISPTNNTFVLDAYSHIFPDISISVPVPSTSPNANSAAVVDISPEVQDFASVLSSFFDHINVKDTLYAIGPLSNEIGKSLIEQGRDAPRRSSSTARPAAVILVDRTLDLATPAMASENPMDLIYDCFPRSKAHGIDCLLDPSLLGFEDDVPSSEKDDTDSWIPVVNVRSNPELNGFLQSLFNKPERQVLDLLKNFLIDFISRHVSPIPEEVLINAQSQDPTPELLESLLQFLKHQSRLLYEYEEHIVFIFALVKSISFNQRTRTELLSAQKVIVALFSQTGEASHIIYQLADMLAKITKEKMNNIAGLATRDVLLLTLHVYALVGHCAVIEPQHEVYLQKGFVQAMLASNPKANTRAVTMWVQRVFVQLGKVSRLRSGLGGEMGDLINEGGSVGFLEKMAQRLVIDNMLDPDLVHLPYRKAMTKVLSGFSMLIGGSVGAAPHPCSFGTVVVFVVGGLTFQETAKMQAIFREKGIRLIVGSNTVCNRDSLMQHIFKSK